METIIIGNNKEQLKIFYKNQMNYQYKNDHNIIKDIIKKNVKPIDGIKETSIIISTTITSYMLNCDKQYC